MAQRGGKWVKQGKTIAHKHFEENLLALEEKNPQIRLDPSTDRFNWDRHAQKYTNLVTQALFIGYSLAINANRTFATGHFVIARADETRQNKPHFSEQPYTHSNYKAARSEMYRLASRHRGSKFILYNSITTQPALPPVTRLAPDGQDCADCVDDNGFMIYTGDVVKRHGDGVEGTVIRSPSEFQVLTNGDADSAPMLYSLNGGKQWTITSKVVEVVVTENDLPEAALDESFCLAGNVNDTEETTA